MLPARLVLLNVLFLLAAGGAWAWYHVSPPQPPVRYSFEARRELPGQQFKEEPIGEAAAKILATTNLINGTFYGPKGERITTFMGTWSAENSKEMSVVGHTPDICWVGSGWTPVATDLPGRIDIEFGETSIPFECRTFRAPDGNHSELTVWCTLVNGQVYNEFDRFEAPTSVFANPKSLTGATGRRAGAGHFLNALRSRNPGTGEKQFVRFSATVAGDWRPVLRDLQAFGQQWLTLHSERGAASSEPRATSPK